MTTFSPRQIDRASLLKITSASHYQRGVAYAEDDRVTLLAMDLQSVEADVAGSETCGVRLECRDGTLHGTCDCPTIDRDRQRTHSPPQPSGSR